MAAGVHHCKVLGCTFTDNAGGGWNLLSTEQTNVFDNNETDHGVGDAVSSFRNASQSIPDSTLTDVVYNVALNDTNNMHDETGAGSAPHFAWAPGWYPVTQTATFEANGTGMRQLSFVRSDSFVFGVTPNYAPPAGSPCTITASGLVYLTAGQSVKAQAYHTAGVSLNLVSIPSYSPSMTMAKN